jgi:hypothetical protein
MKGLHHEPLRIPTKSNMSIQRSPQWICCWLWLVGLHVACGGAVNNSSPSASGAASTGGIQVTNDLPNASVGGASSHPLTSGIGGTSNPAAVTSTGGATSLPSSTGAHSGCEYQGQWYPAGSFWTSGGGCDCMGPYLDGGILVMRHCTEHICYSDGFVSIADVGTYCEVDEDASVE